MQYQSLQEFVGDLCRISEHVVANPLQSPSKAAKELGLNSTISFLARGSLPLTRNAASLGLSSSLFALLTSLFALLTSLFAWRKYKEAQERKQEKERAIREIIASQQAVIRKLETINAQNSVEIDNLKRMLDLLEQSKKQIEKA